MTRPLAFALALFELTALAPSATAAQVELSIRADPPGHDVQNLNGEYALVTNQRTTPLDLSGWRLCDAVVNCFVFPGETIIGPGARLRIHTGSGRDTRVALYMGRTRPIWDNWADLATLSDMEGAIVARCSYDRGRGRDCSPP